MFLMKSVAVVSGAGLLALAVFGETLPSSFGMGPGNPTFGPAQWGAVFAGIVLMVIGVLTRSDERRRR
jgi:hypothetical protein